MPAPSPTHRSSVLTWLGIITIGGLIGCASSQMIEPRPILSAGTSERTESAIRDALRREEWTVEPSGPGEFYAKIQTERLGFLLQVRIVFDELDVRISWINAPNPLGEPDEISDRRKEVRRALRRLADRIEYLIESVELSPA
jgi:hypothetical protein